MRKTTFSLSTIAAALISGTTASADVSFLLAADNVNDASGVNVSTATGSWILVADTLQDGFASVVPSSIGANDFIGGGDDLVVFRGDFTTFATDGIINANPTATLSGDWGAGDPLALIWFPDGGTARSTTVAGDSYGLFTSATGQSLAAGTSDPWITPADGTANHDLRIISSDTFGLAGSSPAGVDASTLNASLAVIPEPSAAFLALLSGGLLLRRRR